MKRKWLRCVILLIVTAAAAAGILLVGTGLMRRADVFISEYRLSEDGNTMIVCAGV